MWQSGRIQSHSNRSDTETNLREKKITFFVRLRVALAICSAEGAGSIVFAGAAANRSIPD
jgi:hypothetical protein